MPVRGGAFQRIGCAQLIATGTSVLTEVPCVLAGMQRGSSVRSHHKGGAVGTSRICAFSLQPSADSRSHMQSAASADVASSRSRAATAKTWRRVLMRAKPKSTAPLRARNKSRRRRVRQVGGGGGETGGAGCRIVGEERIQFGVRLHPPVRLWGQRQVPRVYSTTDVGFVTVSGNPAIVLLRSSPSASKPGICSAARPTYTRLWGYHCKKSELWRTRSM
jgi:hypothetical protein